VTPTPFTVFLQAGGAQDPIGFLFPMAAIMLIFYFLLIRPQQKRQREHENLLKSIGKGDKVVMYYGAANRDPEVFEQPEVFDIARKPNPHLAFGIGTHFCMGSHIARLEMRVTLEEFLRRHPRISLAGKPQYLESNFIGGITRLPLNLA